MDKIKTENTETEILIAAKEIFQQKGMAGARMQEIADKAKINKALLHYYYRSKQLLFEAVFKSAFSLLAPQLNKVLNVLENIKNNSGKNISLAELIVLAGAVGIEKAAKDAGKNISVPFVAGRTDAEKSSCAAPRSAGRGALGRRLPRQ